MQQNFYLKPAPIALVQITEPNLIPRQKGYHLSGCLLRGLYGLSFIIFSNAFTSFMKDQGIKLQKCKTKIRSRVSLWICWLSERRYILDVNRRHDLITNKQIIYYFNLLVHEGAVPRTCFRLKVFSKQFWDESAACNNCLHQ